MDCQQRNEKRPIGRRRLPGAVKTIVYDMNDDPESVPLIGIMSQLQQIETPTRKVSWRTSWWAFTNTRSITRGATCI